MLRLALAFGAIVASLFAASPIAAQTEPRIALVIGNGGYAKGPLATALNDAGLVAEALRTVGFDIVEGGNLTQPDINRDFRDFLGKVQQAGPGAIAFVYFSGYGFEFEGENYLVAADAKLERDTDIPLDAVRLSDLLRPLAGTPAQAKIVVLDSSRQLPFAIQGTKLAPGMAAMDAPPGMLLAMAAAPGIVTPDGQGPYGAYATAIAEMIRVPGIDIADAFTRIRSRVHQLTKGAETPWHVSALQAPVVLVPAAPAAVASQQPPPPPPLRKPRPMRDVGPDEAYAFAIEQDALPAYVEFVEAYPRHPFTPRVWAIIRARREALAWMRALEINTPQSYWTYLRRYPDGIYAADAERRLRRLSAAYAPPPDFIPVDFYGVPPPLVGEPVVFYNYYPPAPPPPIRLIAPPPAIYVNLASPPPPRGPRFLPAPAPLPVMPQVKPGMRVGLPPGANIPPAGPGGIAPGQRPPVPTAAIPGQAPAGAPLGMPPATPGVKPLPGPAPTANMPGQVPSQIPGGLPPRGPGAKPLPGPAPTANVPTTRPLTPGGLPANTGGQPPNGLGAKPPRGSVPTVNAPPPGPPPGMRPPTLPQPAAINRPMPPPPPGMKPPSAGMPPAAINRPAPPPAAARPVPPPPPQAISRPPPQAAGAPQRPAPGAPPKKCVEINGQQMCR